jgi:hypothetical protein
VLVFELRFSEFEVNQFFDGQSCPLFLFSVLNKGIGVTGIAKDSCCPKQ